MAMRFRIRDMEKTLVREWLPIAAMIVSGMFLTGLSMIIAVGGGPI